jgi:hypothetical protein
MPVVFPFFKKESKMSDEDYGTGLGESRGLWSE